MKKYISDTLLGEAGKSMLVQKHQREAVGKQLGKIQSSIDDLSQINSKNLDDLDLLIKQAEMLCETQGLDINDYEECSDDIVRLTDEEKSQIKFDKLEMISKVGVDDDISWEEYMNNISNYAINNNIDLLKDPFANLMSESEKSEIAKRIREDYTMKKAECDRYDYLIAAFCGVATGLIDSFFVGMPGDSKLGNWTDKKVDDMVVNFSKVVWESDKRKGLHNSKSEPKSIKSAIRYLEERFKINYDARYASDLNLGDCNLNMRLSNHHLKSLGHCPDLIGLFFSILDQFTGKSSFISDGKIIRVEPRDGKFELRGENFFAKLFAGFFNWIGHIMSDIAGSSKSKGRGSGLPIPFYEMFLFCEWDSFNDNYKNLADLSVEIFEKGYDFRHGVAMDIPVAINEIMIRLLWTIKSHFYHGNTWKESIPFGEKPVLRRMLLVGHGSLCIVDGADAALRTKLEPVAFGLHLNLVVWSRFAFAGLQEVRLIYNKDALNLSELDNDLQKEWDRLYSDIVG